MTKTTFENIMKMMDKNAEARAYLGGIMNSMDNGEIESDESQVILCEYDGQPVTYTYDELDKRLNYLFKKYEMMAKRFKMKPFVAEEIFDSCIVNRYEVYCKILKSAGISISHIK